MNILEKIIEFKKSEVAERKGRISVSELEKSALFLRPVLSLKASLRDNDKTGIIAEFKRKSPSKGIINANADVAVVTRAYAEHGASGLSVLTDAEFFGGGATDFVVARKNEVPLLRKDFMIDEFQIVEAKSMGADVILLIAACLTPAEVKRLAKFAKSFGLEVLLELHAEEELEHICDETELIGINNRDLKTFKVDIARSIQMAERIPNEKIKIAESGISTVEDILTFKSNGFDGFLIGENFMKTPDPAIAFASFVQQLKTKLNAS